MSSGEPFEEGRPIAAVEGGLVLDIAGFEGPIDLLLALAREQKVDLANISILELADQYLSFVERVRDLRLELAADYLVMAAWLAYLKSRLLLPEAETEEPGAPEMAAALAFHLRRLEAMREAGKRLMARPCLGRDFFVRGAPEDIAAVRRPVFEATLYDLLKAYADRKRRVEDSTLHIEPAELYSMDEAIQRLSDLIGRIPGWETLSRFLPPGLGEGIVGRSALAATLSAGLELVRAGRIRIRQDTAFGPIFVRGAKRPTEPEGG
jgi:segregation and condensation protein A